MACVASPLEQVQTLALLARMAIKLQLDVGVTAGGCLFISFEGGATAAWQIEPGHRHLLGGIPPSASKQAGACSAEATAAAVENALPLSMMWLNDCVEALAESGAPMTDKFATHYALDVWRSHGDFEPRDAVSPYAKGESKRMKFVAELSEAFSRDPARQELDAEDISGIARHLADQPVHQVLNAHQYLQVLETHAT